MIVNKFAPCKTTDLSKPPYHIKHPNATRYEFDSVGIKGSIPKVVEIRALQRPGTYNFGFGNKLADGSVDDLDETNNGDIAAIFSTLLDIIRDFLKTKPTAELFFDGSTQQRTDVYGKLLKRYNSLLVKEFDITGLIKKGGGIIQVDFEVDKDRDYLAYSIRKKS